MMAELITDKLLNGNLLRRLPECIVGGFYGSKGELHVNGEIECSVHGSVPQKELEII